MTGFNANLITYLTQELHLPLVQATNTLTVFKGTSDFTPIIGGLIADSFAGRFWTITVGTIIYELVKFKTISIYYGIRVLNNHFLFVFTGND